MRHLLRLKGTQNAQDACIRTLSNAQNHQVLDASATLAKLNAHQSVGRNFLRHARINGGGTKTYCSKAFTTLKRLHTQRRVCCSPRRHVRTSASPAKTWLSKALSAFAKLHARKRVGCVQFTQTQILLETVQPEKRLVKAQFR